MKKINLKGTHYNFLLNFEILLLFIIGDFFFFLRVGIIGSVIIISFNHKFTTN